MLGKLMKYEWKCLSRPLLILLAVLMGTTLISSLMMISINPDFDEVTENLSFLFMIGSFLIYYLGIIVCSIGTSLMIAIRFYKTCYTDEGYLTHTLPVSAKQLIGAKTLNACLWQLIMMLCTALSLLIFIGVTFTHLTSTSGGINVSDFQTIGNEFEAEFGIGPVGYFVFLITYSLISCITGTCIILGCVSLGQLYTKHRILGAIIAYFLVSMLLQITAYISMIPMYTRLIVAGASGSELTIFEVMQPSFLLIMIISIILAVIMYFVNIHMMTKKLNLE